MRDTLRYLHRLDSTLFRAVTGAHSPRLDSTLLPLTRLADKSILWLLIGLGLAAGGGRFGKRAALRGLVSVCATSLIANQPLKRIAQRRRPALLSKARRLVKRPASYSFPSGHAASAAAFSTAVSMEVPELSAPVTAIALAVAYSRVYSGVHYPSDVVVGAGLGLAVGLGTRRLWPLASRHPAEAPPVTHAAGVPPLPLGEGLTIVLNPSAGSASSAIRLQLLDRLPKARITEVEDPSRLAPAFEQAARDCVAIGVAGGDGSVNAAAAVAMASDKPLVVIPSGTLNHLARDLGVFSLTDAARAVEAGSAISVDVGMIAGRPFLNTASFGSYADLVDSRETLEPKIGKWPALVVAMFGVLSRAAPVEVRIDTRRRKLWMIFVGNCRYRPSGFAPAYRGRLDDGSLDVRLVDASAPWGKTRLLLAVLTGTLAKTRVYEEYVSHKLFVECVEGDLRLASDGEIFPGPAQFSIEKSEKRLIVYRPDPSTAPGGTKAKARRRGIAPGSASGTVAI